MLMVQTVYVDLNVFVNQWFPESKEKYVLDKKEEEKIREAIEAGEIIIPLSLDVVDENSPANHSYNDETVRDKNAKEIFKWSSVEKIWKPIDIMEKRGIETELLPNELDPFLRRESRYEPIFSLATEAKINPTNEKYKSLQERIRRDVMDKKEGMEEGFQRIKTQMSESELDKERKKVEEKLSGDEKEVVYEHKATDEHLFLLLEMLAQKRGVNIPPLPGSDRRIKDSEFLKFHTTNVLKITLFHLLDYFADEKPEGIDIYDLAHAGVGFHADYFISHDSGLKRLLKSSLIESRNSPLIMTFPELANSL